MRMVEYIDAPTINDTVLVMTTLYCDYLGNIEQWLEYKALAVEPDFFAQKILDVSGFEDEKAFKEILAVKRSSALEIKTLIEIYICTAFHQYKPYDVQQMNLEEQVELFAKAEQALGRTIDFDNHLKNSNSILPVPPGMESTDMLSIDEATEFELE